MGSSDTLPTSEDRRWAERAFEYRNHEFETLRESAARWQSALMTLSSLLVASLAVGSPFLASHIGAGAGRLVVVVGVALAASILLAGGWAITTAAFGLPAQVRSSEEFREAIRDKSESVRTSLTWARRAFLGAHLVLIGTIITAFVLSTAERQQLVSVVLRNGTTICGGLAPSQPDKVVSLKWGDAAFDIQIADAVSIRPVDAC